MPLTVGLILGCAHGQDQTPIAAIPQPQQTPTPSRIPKNETAITSRITALRINEEIKLDGRLDERVWSQAQPVKEFRQEEPVEGAPASEKTEVRVLFDDKNLYVGIRAWDSEPQHINARELVRDASFSNDDKVEILLDTYHDRRNAFRFAVNPLGTQQDALITDEGRDVNLSWDSPWLSEGRLDTEGWTVEIAIPLTTLRFKEGLDTWGFNVARIVRRKNEEVLWTSWQRTFGLERVSQAGELTGVEGIRRRRLYEIKPYGSGGWREGVPLVGRQGFDAGLQAKAGLEVAKIGITPSLTAEFTANPDFGQAEVDNQVVNLSRFSVFFPEKRDFFLENSGIFLFGRAESNQLFSPGELDSLIEASPFQSITERRSRVRQAAIIWDFFRCRRASWARLKQALASLASSSPSHVSNVTSLAARQSEQCLSIGKEVQTLHTTAPAALTRKSISPITGVLMLS